MSRLRILRTVIHLKPIQIWFQVWRRLQKILKKPPPCSTAELPEMSFLNLSLCPKGWNDISLDLLWRYNLHYFDYLSSDKIHGTTLVMRWIAENPKGSFPGWDAYPTSLRIVNWIKWLNSKKGQECGVRGKMEASLREQIEWLSNHLEWHIMANHLLANLKALVIGVKWFGGDNRRWLDLYRRQIREQVLPDGGHFERSVMYHAIILEDVLDVISFCGEDVVDLRPTAVKMMRYLVNMTGPDGKFAMFNDASDGISKSTGWLCDYAQKLGIDAPKPEEFIDFPNTGYTRMIAGDFVLFADTAPIGPDYQCGHAHADTLTYELYCKGRKVISDTGTSEYRGCRRSYERSTAAHNVVEVENRDSSEVWGAHRVGSRARVIERQISRNRIYASHNGYGKKVSREFVLTEEGLRVVDVANGRRRCVTRVHLSRNAGNIILVDMDNAQTEDCEIATEFGKVEKGSCMSSSFEGSFSYKITKRGVA